MTNQVYRQLDLDREKLKKLIQEIDWMQNSINNLELAIEFGRCIECDEPLSHVHLTKCEDCLGIK